MLARPTTDVPTDPELLCRWLAGDPDSGEALFDRHFASVRRFFCNKVPASEIEDLMQRTFAACVEHAEQFRGESRFSTYLLAIANSQLHRWLRKRDPVREGLDPAKSSVRDLGVSPSGVLGVKETQAQLLRALQHLPLDLQTVVELRYWEELDSAEIAEVVGVPRGTVRSRLHRARTLLRERLLEPLTTIDTRGTAIAALLAR